MLIDPPLKFPRRPRRAKPRASAPPPPPPPAAPRVVSAVLDSSASYVFVTFDQPVTWDGSGPGTFDTNVGGGSWDEQSDAHILRCVANDGTVWVPEAPWFWDAPDTSLSPVPDPTQTGILGSV